MLFKNIAWALLLSLLILTCQALEAFTFKNTSLQFKNKTGWTAGNDKTTNQPYIKALGRLQLAQPPVSSGLVVDDYLDFDVSVKPLLDQLFVGLVVGFAVPYLEINSGWLPCDGATYVATGEPTCSYQLLADKIRNTYGGSGEYNGDVKHYIGPFCVPDYRGVFLRGSSENVLPADPSRNNTIGSSYQYQADAFQNHAHQQSNLHTHKILSEDSHTHEITTISGQNVRGLEPESTSSQEDSNLTTANNYTEAAQSNIRISSVNVTGVSISTPADSVTPAYRPVRTKSETRPKNFALYYYIKY